MKVYQNGTKYAKQKQITCFLDISFVNEIQFCTYIANDKEMVAYGYRTAMWSTMGQRKVVFFSDIHDLLIFKKESEK